MRWSLVLAGLFLLVPSVAACNATTPILDVDVPALDTPEGCLGLGYAIDPSECHELPPTPIQYDGHVGVTVYVDAPCLLETPTATSDLVIGFGRVKSHPAWIALDVEPARVTITPSELYHPDNFHTDGSNHWFATSRDIKVSVGRGAWPDATQMQVVEERHGVLSLFLKAHAEAGDGMVSFRDSFGVEEMRFDGRAYLPPVVHDVDVQQETPVGIGLLAPLAAALLRRR